VENKIMSTTLKIENMHCGSCVQRVTQALNRIPGVNVEEVRIGAARFNAPPEENEAILAALKKSGYNAQIET
jgi:copper chaperone CopZ